MIAHVVERALAARTVDQVAVATDSSDIARAAELAGAVAVMTSSAHESGTDRVAEAARALRADLVLNLQGDEPLLPPDAIDALQQTLQEAASRGVGLATLARPLEPEEASLPQVVKVVLAEDSTALYFSRSLIPFPRESEGPSPLAHVGLYGYTPAALARFAALPRTRLERAEGLEQLRALGHGMPIAVRVGPWRTQAVDTAEDLERVRSLVLRAQTRRPSGA